MKLIDKDTLVAEIENRIKKLQDLHKENERKLDSIQKIAILLCIAECRVILSVINTLEVKEVEEVPASVELNRYGNRLISTWSGLCEYEDFVIGEEITILLPKRFKAQKGE